MTSTLLSSVDVTKQPGVNEEVTLPATVSFLAVSLAAEATGSISASNKIPNIQTSAWSCQKQGKLKPTLQILSPE